MNPSLLSEHDHQIILDNIEGRENLNHEEYVEDKITTMGIAMILMMMIINNSYLILNLI